MGIHDLFKSKQEREREANMRRRKAFRVAESAIEAVKDRVAKLKKERDAAWQDARKYMRDGQKAAAMRCLQTVRAREVMMAKLEVKRWTFEQLLVKLDLAKTDNEFAAALEAINTVVKIDPDQVANVLGEVEDKLGDQVDVEKIWEKAYGKEMEGAQTQMTDTVPTVEEMLKALEDEVAEDIGGEPSSKERVSRREDAKLKEDIGEGKRRLKDLLEGEK